MANLNVIVEQAKARGDSLIQLDEGIYEINAPIELSTQDSNKARKSLKIIGAGMNRTIINSAITDGSYCFTHTQTSEQAKAYSFSRGLEIRDLTIKGFKNVANCGGIKLMGAFFYTIKNVEILNMKQNGIFIPYDSNLNASLKDIGGGCDAYASAYGKMTNLVIQGCDGWGYRNEIWGSAPNMENCMIVDNSSGGIFLSCPSAKISSCGIGQNGKQNEDGGGILIRYNSNYYQTPHNILIEHCELDTNYNYQIWFDGCTLNKAKRCRFIDRIMNDGTKNKYHGSAIIKFGGNSKETTLCNFVENSNIRLNASSLPNAEKPEITLFDFEKSSYSEARRMIYDIDKNPQAKVWKEGGDGNIITNMMDNVIYRSKIEG